VGQLQRHRVIGVGARAWACRVGGGALVICLLVAASAPPAAMAKSRSCAQRGSKTVHRVGQVRIFSWDKHVYACSTRYGRHVFLYKFAHDNEGNSSLLISAQANQTVVAAGFSQPDDVLFISRNLKTGKQLRRYTDSASNVTIGALVTNGHGSLAWIDESEGPGSITETTVDKDDSTGYMQLDYEYGGAPCMESPEPPPCVEDINASYLKVSNGMVQWDGGPDATILESASFQ
jgi:hypothetical protein